MMLDGWTADKMKGEIMEQAKWVIVPASKNGYTFYRCQCDHCGKQSAEPEKFCPECGRKMTNE